LFPGGRRPERGHRDWRDASRAAIDFKTAADAGFRGAKDEAVLAIGAAAGRVLVSHDLRTMPREFAAFVVVQTSPGVLIVSQKLSLLDAIEELVLILDRVGGGRLGQQNRDDSSLISRREMRLSGGQDGWRRERDSNPRTLWSTVFKIAA